MDLAKYLEFIQGAITRLASQSFALKGWSVTLGVAIIGLTAKDSQPQLAWFALVPTLSFWGLDAYYLALEKQFRELYARALAGGLPTFNMAPEPVTLALWRERLVRCSVFWIHLPVVLLSLGVSFYGYWRLATPPSQGQQGQAAAVSPAPSTTSRGMTHK
jgi:hypothetical protein